MLRIFLHFFLDIKVSFFYNASAKFFATISKQLSIPHNKPILNMPKPLYIFLSRREAQIMDIIYKLGEASVADVLKKLPDPPGYNSIRVLLTILEKKGYLTHKKEGQRYIYVPTEVPAKAKRSALDHVTKTFFEGSTPKVVSALLDSKITERDLIELSKLIEQAKRERQK